MIKLSLQCQRYLTKYGGGLDMKEIVIISESMAQQIAWENAAKTGVSGNDFLGFGNGKGIAKAHSRNSGTGRELK